MAAQRAVRLHARAIRACLSFEPGEGGRLIETLASGKVFEIGKITVWAPPTRLVFGWRQATFQADQDTEVEVRFEPVGAETRVTVEHRGLGQRARRRMPPATAFPTPSSCGAMASGGKPCWRTSTRS